MAFYRTAKKNTARKKRKGGNGSHDTDARRHPPGKTGGPSHHAAHGDRSHAGPSKGRQNVASPREHRTVANPNWRSHEQSNHSSRTQIHSANYAAWSKNKKSTLSHESGPPVNAHGRKQQVTVYRCQRVQNYSMHDVYLFQSQSVGDRQSPPIAMACQDWKDIHQRTGQRSSNHSSGVNAQG